MDNKKEMSGVPSAEDFSPKAVQKSVSLDALQHPTTLLPAAVSLLSAMYMGLISFDPTSFAAAFGSGLLALASYVYHYFVRGDQLAARQVRKLQARRNRYKEEELDRLEGICRGIGFSDGENAAVELKEAYLKLRLFLEERFKQKKSMMAQRFLILAEDCYYQGLALLKKGVSLYSATSRMDEGKLRNELKNWQRELEEVESSPQTSAKPTDSVIGALRAKVGVQQRRLELYENRRQTLQELLAQIEVLEATLEAAYLEVVDLIDDESHLKRSSVAANLQQAVAAARKVENRLRRLNKDDYTKIGEK